jgi:hypothetical protein
MDHCSYGKGNLLADLPCCLKVNKEEVLYFGAIVCTCLELIIHHLVRINSF